MKSNRVYIVGVLLATCTLLTGHKLYAQITGPLFGEIVHLDSLQFDAFNRRQLDKMMGYFDQNLEWFQDNTGVRNYGQVKQAFGGLFKMDYVLTRKLIPGTIEVYPIKDYGAIETGQHTFSHMENGQLQVGTFRFMQIWQKKDGVWHVTREISYSH